MSTKANKSIQKSSGIAFHDELLLWAPREFVMDSSNHEHYGNNRKNSISIPALVQSLTKYMATHFSNLKGYKNQHYNNNFVGRVYRTWFKNKYSTNKRRLNKFRLACKDKVKELLVSTDAKDLPLKTKELLGPWWSRLQGRILSPYMHKDALDNKGKHKKRNKSSSTSK
eukprot:127704_1